MVKEKKMKSKLKRQMQQESEDSGDESDEEKDIKDFMQKARKSLKMNNEELNFANKIAVKNKKEKKKVLEEMVASQGKESRTQNFKNKVFKLDYTMNAKIRRRKKQRKEQNLAKINKMKIKRVKE